MRVKNISIDVILLAAGSGERFQKSLSHYKFEKEKLSNMRYPKALIKIFQKPIYQYSIDLFKPIASEIFLVLPKKQTLNQDIDSTIKTLTGGRTRFHSVFKALKKIAAHHEKKTLKELRYQWVLVHDCARVVFDKDDLKQLITKANEIMINHQSLPGLIMAKQVTDSIKKKSNKGYKNINRSRVFAAQTPQLFRFTDLYQAYQKCEKHYQAITDEASAIEKNNQSFAIVISKKDNFKINTYTDFLLAEQVLELKQTNNEV